MKLTCFIFTHAPEAPLLSRCIAAARLDPGNHEVSFVVAEDGNSPLPDAARAALTADGVAVVRTATPRHGNLRGVRWFAEQMTAMSDHAGDADVVLKIDPDTLVLSLANVVKPLVDDPALAGAGFGRNESYVYGPCYAFRRWIVDALAAKYNRLAENLSDELQDAWLLTNQGNVSKPLYEDVIISREALSFGPLSFNQNRVRWRHDRDGRDMAAVKAHTDVVLFGNPSPVNHAGGDARLAIAKIMDAFLAADTVAPPLAEDQKPVVVLGLGPGRSGTSFMATLLNMQPGAWISHESYSPVLLNLPNVDGFARRLVTDRPGRHFIGDFTPAHIWMAAGMTRWLVAQGYAVKLVVTDRDEKALAASWLAQLERQEHDPFVTEPPEGWTHRGWSKALPKFDTVPERKDRVLAYLAWCRDHVAALEAEFTGMVRHIDTADMNDPAEINGLLDWIGIPAAGRRLELLGTPVNTSPTK
jgi:hypothetical protein